MGPACWRSLRPGSAGLLLCVDFGGGSRLEAGFPALAPMLPPDLEIWEAEFAAADPRTRAAEQVAYWLKDIARQGRTVMGVLGYCAGASLACALADTLADSGARWPPALLFDPEVVDARVFYWQFVQSVDPVTGVLPEARLDEIRQAADELTRAAPAAGTATTLDDIAQTLSGRYGELVDELGRELGLDDEEVTADMRSGFDGYFAYLLIASRARLGSRHGSPVVMLSRDHHPVSIPDSREIRFEVTHAKLLGDVTVGAQVADIVTVHR